MARGSVVKGLNDVTGTTMIEVILSQNSHKSQTDINRPGTNRCKFGSLSSFYMARVTDHQRTHIGILTCYVEILALVCQYKIIKSLAMLTVTSTHYHS